MIAIFVAITSVFVSTLAYSSSQEKVLQNSFSENDILAAVARHVKSEHKELEKAPRPTITIPLYNLSDELIAYKVIISDDSYIVVNANKENPVVIEFTDPGYVKDEQITTIKNAKEYYLAPGVFAQQQNAEASIFALSDSVFELTTETKAELDKLEEAFGDFLNVPNKPLASIHNNAVSLLQSSARSTGTDEDKYDFLLTSYQLPGEASSTEMITNIGLIKNSTMGFGTTSEFGSLSGVRDHCAATSAFNLMLYYSSRTEYPIPDHMRTFTFQRIHSYFGNGPVTPSEYRTYIENYVAEDTDLYSAVSNPSNTWANYKEEIDAEHMNVMCVWPALLDAHMINGVGYRIYETSGNYCVVIDNWVCNAYRYTLFGESLFDLLNVYIGE